MEKMMDYIKIEIFKKFGNFKHLPKISKGKIIKETEKAILFHSINCNCKEFQSVKELYDKLEEKTLTEKQGNNLFREICCEKCVKNRCWIPKSCLNIIKENN